MTTKRAVQQAPSPQKAMLVLAEALDRIEAKLDREPTEMGWGKWDTGESAGTVPYEHYRAQADKAFEIMQGEDSVVIDIKPVSQAKQEKRREFAVSTLQIEDNFPGIGAAEAYVLGGPVWLYEFDYQYVKNLPAAIKQMMVTDLLEDDPQAAAEMGRDLLKSTAAEGPPSTGGEWV